MFRTLKSPLEIHPVYHWTERRVRALATVYVCWLMLCCAWRGSCAPRLGRLLRCLYREDPGRFFHFKRVEDGLLGRCELCALQDPPVRALKLAEVELSHSRTDITPCSGRLKLGRPDRKECQPAKEHMGSDAIAQAVVDRSKLERLLQAAKRVLHLKRLLVPEPPLRAPVKAPSSSPKSLLVSTSLGTAPQLKAIRHGEWPGRIRPCRYRSPRSAARCYPSWQPAGPAAALQGAGETPHDLGNKTRRHPGGPPHFAKSLCSFARPTEPKIRQGQPINSIVIGGWSSQQEDYCHRIII